MFELLSKITLIEGLILVFWAFLYFGMHKEHNEGDEMVKIASITVVMAVIPLVAHVYKRPDIMIFCILANNMSLFLVVSKMVYHWRRKHNKDVTVIDEILRKIVEFD